MTTNVSLTPHLEEFIRQGVASGRFQSASEVVRTALRLLEEREREKAATLEWLSSELQKGIDSGPSEPLTPEFWDGLHERVRSRAADGDVSAD